MGGLGRYCAIKVALKYYNHRKTQSMKVAAQSMDLQIRLVTRNFSNVFLLLCELLNCVILFATAEFDGLTDSITMSTEGLPLYAHWDLWGDRPDGFQVC